MRVKEVVLWVILRVNFAKPRFMETMNCTHICLLNTTLVIYAKGNNQANHVLNSCVFMKVQTVKNVIFVIFVLIAGSIQDSMNTIRIMMT